MKCLICAKPTKDKLCYRHSSYYLWDSSIQGFRLRQRGRGSRYNTHKFHLTETKLAKIIENLYGKSDVAVSYYPMWATSPKGVLYEYDILVKSKKLLIAYHGEQHYKFTKFFHKTKKAFSRLQSNDKVKRELSNVNKYKYIEFAYNEPIIKEYVVGRMFRN